MNDSWDKLDPGFFEPVWLLVGALTIVAIILLEIGALRRRRYALQLFAAPHLASGLTSSVSRAKRFWKRLLFIAGVAFLFVALARPHLYYQWQEENRAGIDLLIAFDCSKSMLTEDVKPNRIQRAKLAIADFADRLPDDRLGLVAFSGDAFLQIPLTLDHDAFQAGVRELDTDTIPRPGTDIGAAIDEAVSAFKSQAANTKILILVTDGEDLEGRDIEAAKNAAQAGLKIFTVGVGTAGGDLIPQRDDSGAMMYLHDSSGQIVKSKLDESGLRQIASLTGGTYAALGQRGEGLDEIYHRFIEPLPKKHVESRREKIRFERYEWPLTLSILCLVASMLMNERAGSTSPAADRLPPARRRPSRPPLTPASAALILSALGLMSVPLAAATAETAERDYKSGKYPEAAQNYKQAVDIQPNKDELKYNLGAAAYKAGQYSQAEDAFRKSLETPDLALQEKSYYNLGNSQFRQGETTQKDDEKRTIDLWEQALKSYESSMKLKPSADAKYNHELVKQKLEQLKQKQKQDQKQQNDKSNPNQKDDKSKPGDGQGSKPDASKKQDPNKPQDSGQPKNQNGQDQAPNKPSQPNDQGQGQQPSPSDAGKEKPMQSHSTSREVDKADPGAKSKQDAEALLDSLKDDEKHVNARVLNGNNETPPPPSGKDW